MVSSVVMYANGALEDTYDFLFSIYEKQYQCVLYAVPKVCKSANSASNKHSQRLKKSWTFYTMTKFGFCLILVT